MSTSLALVEQFHNDALQAKPPLSANPGLEKLDPRNQAPLELLRLGAERNLTERQIRRWLGAVIGQGEYSPAQWGQRGIFKKSLFTESAALPYLTLESVQTSTLDNFEKLLFKTHDDLRIETVLIPLLKENCVSVCLSSQIGCAMACAFCATGRMTKRRNLETWEIVDQFIQARTRALAQGRKVTGAVFMGMGEPFLNYERVLAAAELLRFPVVNAIDARAITISTVGVAEKITRFIDEKRPFRLSISLGAATDEKRAKLVPVASKTAIKDILALARRYAAEREDRVNLSYVCIGGENMAESDAEELGRLLADIPVRLDLIEVNDSTTQFRRPTEEEMSHFRDALRRHVGQPVVRRYSGGADINAACGTLAGA